MLEVLGALLLMFLVVTLGLLWLGIRLARRVMRNVRAFAGGFSGAANARAASSSARGGAWGHIAALRAHQGGPPTMGRACRRLEPAQAS